jgi:gas vesicle structural protein
MNDEIPGRAASERRRQVAAKRRARALERSRARREAAAVRRDQVLERSRERREASRERQEASMERARRERHVSLLDLVDRLLDGGVVIHGDITLAVADVDLLYVGLRAMVASVETIERTYGVSLSARGASLSSSAL